MTLGKESMFTKTEIEFIKSPHSFSAGYSRVLRHRINSKVQELRNDLPLLQSRGFSFTEYCNGVTEFRNDQQNQKSLNQPLFANKSWGTADELASLIDSSKSVTIPQRW